MQKAKWNSVKRNLEEVENIEVEKFPDVWLVAQNCRDAKYLAAKSREWFYFRNATFFCIIEIRLNIL